jgi:hypothetical protein
MLIKKQDIEKELEKNIIRDNISRGKMAQAFFEHIRYRVNLEYTEMTDAFGRVKSFTHLGGSSFTKSYGISLVDLVVPCTSFTNALKIKLDMVSKMINAEEKELIELKNAFLNLIVYGVALIDNDTQKSVNARDVAIVDDYIFYEVEDGIYYDFITEEFYEVDKEGNMESAKGNYEVPNYTLIHSPVLDTELTDDIIAILREVTVGDTLTSSVLQKVANPIMLISEDLKEYDVMTGQYTVEIDGKKVVIKENSRVEVVDRPTKTNEWLSSRVELMRQLSAGFGVNDFILGVAEATYNASGEAFKLAFFRILVDVQSKLNVLREYFEFEEIDIFAEYNLKQQAEIDKIYSDIKIQEDNSGTYMADRDLVAEMEDEEGLLDEEEVSDETGATDEGIPELNIPKEKGKTKSNRPKKTK